MASVYALLAVTIPRGMFGTQHKIADILEQFLTRGVQDVWAGTANSVALARNLGCNIHGGYALNVSNAATLQWYE